MDTAITVDNATIRIPLKVLDDTDGAGITVLTLAPGAYLIIRSDLSQHHSDRLAEVLRAAASLQHPPSKSVPPSTPTLAPRKQRVLQELREKGHPVSDGVQYGLQAWLRPDVTLNKVQQGLGSISGSLSDIVIDERGED